MATYTLLSDKMIYAPGIVRWGIAHYWHEPDRRVIENVIMTWGVPREAAQKLLSKQVECTIDDTKEEVTFTV